VTRISEAFQRLGGRSGSSAIHSRAGAFVSAWEAETEPHRDSDYASVIKPQPLLVQAEGGALPESGTQWIERFAASRQCDPMLLEQFRRLAATLHQTQTASGIRTILVTSTNPGEGKTLTALNLAVVLSESYGRSVLLIDVDLRRPSIRDVVDVSSSIGLSAALKADADGRLAVIPMSATLTLLPAGPPDPDPLKGLTSPRMRRILDEAAARFDWVILDGPPSAPLADSSLLAQMADGTLFVVLAAHTHYGAIQKAIESIGRERVLGIVLNRVSRDSLSAYTPYSYSSDGLAEP
jgi:capsular exopolysaccharide synthesis family protein